MMEKCLEHTHFQAKAPYDKERFDLKKELIRERDILKKALGKEKSKVFFYIEIAIKHRNYVGFCTGGIGC
ncbi:hypothetical protein wCauATS_14910 [Wolbachia pipientis]|uniref:hypothetical protein n=1 Tax=Wolbachia pipientis TaxID=955 RepID=UPI0038B699BC